MNANTEAGAVVAALKRAGLESRALAPEETRAFLERYADASREREAVRRVERRRASTP